MSTDTTAPKSALTANKEFKIDAQEDAKAVDKLVTARIGLLLKHGFFGNMASRLKLVNADEWLTTAATDGRNFYYCSKFINSLSVSQKQEVYDTWRHTIRYNYDRYLTIDHAEEYLRGIQN